MGYAGIFMDCGEYTMSNDNPYVNPPNHSATPNYNIINNASNLQFLNDNDHAIIRVQHVVDLIVWSNHKVVHSVIKEALTKAVHNKYKPAVGIGQ